MTSAEEIRSHILSSIDNSCEKREPFRHWLLRDVFPAEVCAAVRALPLTPPAIDGTEGKRETHNSTRVFFSAENLARFAVCRALADTLQSEEVVARLWARCNTALGGSYLRVEYCQDIDGFWLEPHTDIGAKLFTMLVYLSTDQDSATWGTDLMTPEGGVIASVPYRANHGVIFIPGQDTWHGFRKRPIAGVRRSIIVNYVKDEWRSRHELAFPNRSVF